MSARVFFITGGVLLGIFLLVFGARALAGSRGPEPELIIPTPTPTGFAIIAPPISSLVSGALGERTAVTSNATPTAGSPSTPAPTVLIQADWPTELGEGGSDTVVVSLIQTKDGLSVAQVEQAGQTAVPATLVPRGTPGVPYSQAYGPDYSLTAASAVLSASNIDIVPVSAEVQPYPLEENSLSWLWNISPRRQGKQAMTADVRFRWESQSGGPMREHSVWQYSLETLVGPPDQFGAVAINSPPNAQATSQSSQPDPVGFWADALSVVTGLGAVFAFAGGALRWGMERSKGLRKRSGP